MTQEERITLLEAEIDQLAHDLNNAKCAARMAMELVGRCKVCNNRTEILGRTDEITNLLNEN